jgi:SAM-dependent methyltransferase
VVAVDVAPLALEGARALDPEQRVDFRQVNLFDLPPDLRGAFDVVWEHTCLSALSHDLRNDYVRGVKSALKPDGQIVGVFYINPDMAPGEPGPPFAISVDELIQMWTGGDMEVVEHWTPSVSYPGREGREEFMWLKWRSQEGG